MGGSAVLEIFDKPKLEVLLTSKNKLKQEPKVINKIKEPHNIVLNL
jgi:hypothetical protein